MGVLISGWSGGVHEDTTNTIAILVDCNSEVAILTPVRTPRVSHDQKFLAVLVSITDCSHSVVQVSTTSAIIHDTLPIKLEGGTRGVNGNASWLLVHGSLDLGDTLRWNASVGSDTDLLFRGVGLACTVRASVAIVDLEFHLFLLSIFEGLDL